MDSGVLELAREGTENFYSLRADVVVSQLKRLAETIESCPTPSS